MNKVTPRRLRGIIENYNLSSKKVLDLGAGDGSYLMHFGNNSAGLEIGKENVTTANKAKLNMMTCDLESDAWPVNSFDFDVVWCSNYLEHSLSPHRLLIKSRGFLNDQGVIVIAVPLAYSFSNIVSTVFSQWRGYSAADHVNFFNRKSIMLTIERAGFDLIEVYST